MSETFEEVLVCGQPALFFDSRIERNTVPDGLYLYEVRYDDDNIGEPVEIARNILVNYYGCIITNKPIELNERGFLVIDPDNDWNYSCAGDCRSIREFVETYLPDKAGEL